MSGEDLMDHVAEQVEGDSVTKPWEGMMRVEDLEDLLDMMEVAAEAAEGHRSVTEDTVTGVRLAVAIVRDDFRRGER